MIDGITAGTTSYIMTLMAYDSSSTVGAGKTGITYNGGITCYYKRSNGSADVSCTINTITTLGTYAGSATNAAWKEVDSTNMPGVYELHIPNNAFASGATDVMIYLLLSGVVPIVLYFRINPPADLQTVLGTAPTAATAGILDVNAKNINNAAAPTLTGDAYARLGAPTGASIDADIEQIYNLIKSGGGGDVTAILTAIQNGTYGLSAIETLLASTGIKVGSFSAGAINNAAFNADVNTTAYASNNLALMLYKFFDNAFTSYGTWAGYAFTSGGFLDRFTKLAWLLRNQVSINDTSGNTTVCDDGGNTWTTVAGALTDSSGTTERLRIA
jgi:hypothetical protein